MENHQKPSPPGIISEAMRQKAKVCETIAQDKTQESLTGESSEKAVNEEAAKAWLEKSRVWAEAEAMVRANPTDPVPPAR